MGRELISWLKTGGPDISLVKAVSYMTRNVQYALGILKLFFVYHIILIINIRNMYKFMLQTVQLLDPFTYCIFSLKVTEKKKRLIFSTYFSL